MKFFSKIPTVISVPFFYLMTTTYVFFRFILGTVPGSFLLVVGTYIYIEHSGEIQPLSLLELSVWIGNLDKEYKIAILSSFVTIVGFVVAFDTATMNWKSQMQAQLKYQVSCEIEEFFNGVLRDISIARIYAELVTGSVTEIQEGCSNEEAIFKIQYIEKQHTIYVVSRDRLLQHSIEIHRLLGRNYNILSTGWQLVDNINLATKALKQITEKMWLGTPVILTDNTNCIELFLKYVDVPKLNEFIRACNDNYDNISILSGSTSGYLMAPLVDFNLFALLNMFSKYKGFKKMHNELYHKMKNNN